VSSDDIKHYHTIDV